MGLFSWYCAKSDSLIPTHNWDKWSEPFSVDMETRKFVANVQVGDAISYVEHRQRRKCSTCGQTQEQTLTN